MTENCTSSQSFDWSQFLYFDDDSGDGFTSAVEGRPVIPSFSVNDQVCDANCDDMINITMTNDHMVIEGTEREGSESSERLDLDEGSQRVAFRTRTEKDVLDDGFRWRKYGKKRVKNSPNPRNYYKCSSGELCPVKKRVERDPSDGRYVITTYEGMHNHESPTVDAPRPSSVAGQASPATTSPRSWMTTPTWSQASYQ